MSAILLSPHNLGDDETIFAFHTLTRTEAHVIVVLRSHAEERQGGPTFAVRELETECAMKVAGVTWEQWHYPDTDPDWAVVGTRFRAVAGDYDTVIGPAYEEGGHEHHNECALIAASAKPDPAQRIHYLTYVRGHGRSEHGVEVVPTLFEREQKRIALLCYQSQIEWEPTRSWFGSDQREFVL